MKTLLLIKGKSGALYGPLPFTKFVNQLVNEKLKGRCSTMRKIVYLKTPGCTLGDYFIENKPEWITPQELKEKYDNAIGTIPKYFIIPVWFDDTTRGAIVCKNDGTAPFPDNIHLNRIYLDNPDFYHIDKVLDEDHNDVTNTLRETDEIRFSVNGLEWEGRFDGETIEHYFGLDSRGPWATVISILYLNEDTEKLEETRFKYIVV